MFFSIFNSRTPNKGILTSVLQNIGNTPLVRINKIGKAEGVECDICKFSINCFGNLIATTFFSIPYILYIGEYSKDFFFAIHFVHQ